MRRSTALKTLLRSPLKTLLTFLLIAAASFALFSRVTDHAVTTRETKNAKSLYHAVASLDNEVPDIPLITASVMSPDGTGGTVYGPDYEMEDKPWPSEEELEEFESLPGVGLADTRYMTAGRVEDYKRLAGAGDVNAYVVLEGTYAGYEDDATVLEDHVRLKFDDVKVIASEGGPEIGESITMEDVPLGENYYAPSPYTRAFYDSLGIGSRCLVLVNNTGIIGAETGIMFPYDIGEGALCVLDGQPDDYLETESFVRQKGWVDAINYNNYAYDIVYTSDMRAIPAFNEQSRIVSEGRLLTNRDTDACVVSEEFLKAHSLSVGDSISIQLGGRLCHRSAKVTEGEDVPEFVDNVKLTVAGSYAGAKGESVYSYSPNTIYVPSGLLPVDIPEDYEPNPDEFSVFVENADKIEAFHKAAMQFADKMDLKLDYSDRGWLDVKDSLEMGTFTSLLTTILYVIGAVLALLLAVYLYIGRYKRTYAILRMLGVPARAAEGSVVLPFAVVSALAVPVGGMAGLFYAQDTAEKALIHMSGSAPAGYVMDASLPVRVIMLCLASELLFVSLTAYSFLRRMKKIPPLMLLQESVRTGRKTGNMSAVMDVSLTGDVPVRPDLAKISAAGEWKEQRNYSAVRHVVSYIWRHMRRGIGKTAVSLLLAIVLSAGIGTFVLARITYRDVFYELGVKGKASGFTFASVVELSKSPLVKDFHCQGSFGVRVQGSGYNIPLTVTNNLAQDLGKDYTVDYLEGFDLSAFDGTAQVCLAGKGIAGKLGISSGDEIGMLSDILYSTLKAEEGGEDALFQSYKPYKVIGIVESGDENITNGIFTGIRSDLQRLFSMDFPMGQCEFTLADNDRVEELAAFLEAKKDQSYLYSPDASYHLDTGGLSNIERIRGLLEALFPIAVAAAVLIGLFGPLLVILQSAQEAAFLRILGVTKKRARCMLVFEQIILCIAGILLVAGGLALYDPGRFTGGIDTFLACFALYFLGCICGACAAAVQVTRGRLLELLQVKE